MHHNEAAGRSCARCHISLEGRRPHAIYCSDRCRNNAGHLRRYHADLDASRARARAKARRQVAAKSAAATPPSGRLSRLWLKLIVLLAPFAGVIPL
jgi:hypothetical protein